MRLRGILPKPRRSLYSRTFATSTTLSRYNFDVGVSWHSSYKQTLQRLPLGSRPAMFRDKMLKEPPRPSSSRSPGDDFFFVQQMLNSSGIAVGIADGVGGWRSQGIDPSPFSQSLMYHAARFCGNAWPGVPNQSHLSTGDARSNFSPLEALQLGYEGVLGDRGVHAGSSTACILTFNSYSGLLRSANLGDSGFVVFRDGKLILQSHAQVSASNAPFQLSKIPASWKFVGEPESPDLADTSSLVLQNGDIAILFTDGLSDNIHLGDMQAIIANNSPEVELREDYAQRIADTLVYLSLDSMYKPPKMNAPLSLAGRLPLGGKPDDVTVATVVVRRQE